MADLRSLLDTPLDEIKVFTPYPGTYNTVLLSGKLGDPTTDKNGRAYQRMMLAAKLVAPTSDVGSEGTDAFNEQTEEIPVYFSKLIYGRNDLASVGRLLGRLGVSIEGRSLEDALASIKGAGYEARALLEHREYQGEMRAEVKELLPIE